MRKIAVLLLLAFYSSPAAAQEVDPLVDQLGIRRGIVVVVTDDAVLPLTLARKTKCLIYVHAPSANVAGIRRQVEAAGFYGSRVYVEFGSRIALADNLADGAIVTKFASAEAKRRLPQELLRVVHPGAKIIAGGQVQFKSVPQGGDDWSHPYHGPDNNPQSRDQQARAPFLTQFLSEPWYVPMPQVTVAAGGRVFKAFGHIALKRREWPWLNTLLAINGYNGTHLWKRPLKAGFMIHRSTLIATGDRLYLADSDSCKVLNAADGKLVEEIKVAKSIDSDGVWKWMGLKDGVLYALLGPPEIADKEIRGTREQPGWPWSGLGPAYGGKYAWGFGRTVVALRISDKKMLWHRKYQTPVDSRALCVSAGRMFVYSHQQFLECLNTKTGKPLWRRNDKKLLAAIGEHDRAQTAPKGFASSAYAKANEQGVYFAGPQRRRIVGVSSEDGRLLWSYPDGNFQLVLRPDGLYAMGRKQTSKKFDYQTGRILADLECYRGNCTRATGTVDSIFTRGYRHTGTMRLELEGNKARRIPLMRPACQDGVVVSQGHLYWGPWMCDCNHSLIGTICLAPAGKFFDQTVAKNGRLQRGKSRTPVNPKVGTTGWPAYRAGVERQAGAAVRVGEKLRRIWEWTPISPSPATAPVASQGMVIRCDRAGRLVALDAASGEVRWKKLTAGAVQFPAELANGRVYLGGGDGYVYCFDATSGEQHWRFRASPLDRRILVHGRLLSTWPVGSGVLVREGTVYVAAGIASYDGTHVLALDAKQGTLRWQNNTSGNLVDRQQVTGVSVQGHLLFHNGRLYLAGGNVVSPAMYDVATGECLNTMKNEWWKRPENSPERFPSKPRGEMFQRSPRGRELFLVDGKVRVFDQLLYSPVKYGPSRYFGGHFMQASLGKSIVRATNGRIVRLAVQKTGDGKLVGLWQTDAMDFPKALAVTQNVVAVAGLAKSAQAGQPQPALLLLDLANGKVLARQPLSAEPVNWGLAVDEQGRIFITLQDGRTVGFATR